MYLYTVSPHDSKQMKGKKDTRSTLSSNPEANTQVYTSELIFKVASYSLISDIFRSEVTPLDTDKTQEVSNGSRWKTCS